MERNSNASISSLPVETHPGYSARKAMESFVAASHRLMSALEPSFFRRILGGTNSDYARSVSAACNENARLVRAIFQAVGKRAADMEESAAQVERDKGKAIGGTCRRVVERLDEWRSIAMDFEANALGSKPKLIDLTKRLNQLAKEIEHPAAGLQ